MTASRRARYLTEYALMRFAFAVFQALSLDRASALGGWIGRTLGPRLKITDRARENLTRAFPDMTDAARADLIVAMWDHLGRVFAEYPHLGDFHQLCIFDEQTFDLGLKSLREQMVTCIAALFAGLKSATLRVNLRVPLRSRVRKWPSRQFPGWRTPPTKKKRASRN